MPDLWTHIFCGREALAGVEERFRKAARDLKNLFFLGCQGPDLFFYYDFLPWGDKRVFSLGNRIHHERCGLFFRESLKFARRNPDAGTIVYLMGLVCHWCLDRVTHPYIYYISGVYQGHKAETRKLINNHKRVEAAIDVLMGRRLLKTEVWKVPAHREIEVGDCLPEEIVAFYRHILPLVHADSYEDLKGTDFINKSYRDMIKALKILHDPLGVKRGLAALFDALSGGALNLRYYFYRPGQKNGEAHLNEQRKTWCHPMDAGEIHTESFQDLFRMGVEESVDMIRLSLRFLRGEAEEDEINGKIVDISHSTGKPDSDRRPMRFFSPVLEEE
ncbi:MAG: zinc dependent phospholipase C family protein [Peptococcaceae bacterium]|nr:zinc dependent phospholipase C family protein [Peptococcaceae bacterium]